VLPKPPRLLVEPDEVLPVELPVEDEERPTTVEGWLVPDGAVVLGAVVVVVDPPRLPHHHQPVPCEP
jgi:hypothetical protein